MILPHRNDQFLRLSVKDVNVLTFLEDILSLVDINKHGKFSLVPVDAWIAAWESRECVLSFLFDGFIFGHVATVYVVDGFGGLDGWYREGAPGGRQS